MERDRERETIAKAVESLERTTGQRPAGWLSRYLHTDSTRCLLAEAGFLYHMDDYSRDVPFWEPVTVSDGTVRPLICVPYAIDSNDMKMWSAPAYTPEQWFRYAVDTFDRLWLEGAEEPRMMSLGLHLRIIGRPGRFVWLERFVDHALSRGGVWVATRADIAARWAELRPYDGEGGA